MEFVGRNHSSERHGDTQSYSLAGHMLSPVTAIDKAMLSTRIAIEKETTCYKLKLLWWGDHMLSPVIVIYKATTCPQPLLLTRADRFWYLKAMLIDKANICSHSILVMTWVWVRVIWLAITTGVSRYLQR